MLRLKNIKRDAEFIYADYYPEDWSSPGHIKLSVKDGAVVEEKRSTFPDEFEHLSMARRALNKLRTELDIPSERLVMWY